MKNTWIITMEATAINKLDAMDEKALVEFTKKQLDVDDVVITNIQKFEGADEDDE